MIFEIISKELGAVRNAGYEIDINSRLECSFPEGMTQNKQSDLIDSFYDVIDDYLCQDKDGDMYAVLYDWHVDRYVPVVWQRVKKNVKEKE